MEVVLPLSAGFTCIVRIGFVFSLIFLEISHPLGPVGRLNAASRSQGTIDGELAMPFQLPQLLKPYFPGGEIHKEHIRARLVPVDGEVHHFPVEVIPLAIVLGRNDAVEIGV